MKIEGRILAACLIGLGAIAEAAPAFSMPVAPSVPVGEGMNVLPIQWGGPPPPGWGGPPGYRPPPPPGWGPPGYRPPPPGWGHRPPPPPPGWGRRPPPPPPGWGYRPPPVYRAPPGIRAHIGWCQNRYRSYNPTTNRYLSSGGFYRVCVSPFRY